ncbi:MAG: hypothetical protein AAFS10_12215, partial [Myxococcota bacterium]
MNIAILGGSFNPPHVCHVLSATWVLSTRPVDEVWLMPVGQHAFGKGLESFAHRQPMCELAIQPIAGVCRVTDIEHRLGGEDGAIGRPGIGGDSPRNVRRQGAEEPAEAEADG